MIRYIVPNKTIKPLKTNKISSNLKWNQTKSEALVIKSNILANFDSLAALGFRTPFGDFLFYSDTEIRDTIR